MQGNRTTCYVNDSMPVVTENNENAKLVSDKDVYTIKPYYLLSFSCSGSQPFFTVKTHRCEYKEKHCKPTCYWSGKCKHAHYKNYKVELITAKNLKKGYFLLIPRHKKIIDVNKIAIAKKYTDINNDFLRIVSLYLTAGSVNEKYLKFTFNIKEIKYVSFIKEYFIRMFPDITVSFPKHKDKNLRIVAINNKFICDYFKRFGISRNDKKMPNYLLELPFEKQKILVECLIDGNGHRDEIGKKFYTVSKTLSYQVKTILDRLGIISGMHKYKNENYNYYQLSIFENSYNVGIVADNCIYTPIAAIKRTNTVFMKTKTTNNQTMKGEINHVK